LESKKKKEVLPTDPFQEVKIDKDFMITLISSKNKYVKEPEEGLHLDVCKLTLREGQQPFSEWLERETNFDFIAPCGGIGFPSDDVNLVEYSKENAEILKTMDDEERICQDLTKAFSTGYTASNGKFTIMTKFSSNHGCSGGPIIALRKGKATVIGIHSHAGLKGEDLNYNVAFSVDHPIITQNIKW